MKDNMEIKQKKLKEELQNNLPNLFTDNVKEFFIKGKHLSAESFQIADKHISVIYIADDEWTTNHYKKENVKPAIYFAPNKDN